MEKKRSMNLLTLLRILQQSNNQNEEAVAVKDVFIPIQQMGNDILCGRPLCHTEHVLPNCTATH